MNLQTQEVASTAAPSSPGIVADSRYCVKCGYLLSGLPVNGACPECGTQVELSLREPTLEAADPEYRNKVHAGLSMVLNGLLLLVIVTIASFFIGVTGAAGGSGIMLLGPLLNLVVNAMLLLGYWKYTEPDPAQVMLEGTRSARGTIRITVLIQMICGVVSVVLAFVGGNLQLGAGAPPAFSLAAMIASVATLVASVAWLVQFFSVMRYTRWLASRVPDAYIIRRTRRYMWLLPLIAIIGVFLFFLGPLIALVMYWNLLDRLRKHFKSIKLGQGPANLKGRLTLDHTMPR